MGTNDESPRPALRALAAYCGILPGFHDWRGAWCDTSDDSREALLAAMGIDAASEVTATRALAALRAEDEASEPIAVLDRARGCFTVRPPPADWPIAETRSRILLRDAMGRSIESDAVTSGGDGGLRVEVAAAGRIHTGYYDVETSTRAGGASRPFRCFLLVPPRQSPSVASRGTRRRELGIATNLYSLRSEENWGVGDLGDVRRLAAVAGPLGVGWVGVSPLHATANRGRGVSPYFPTSRLFGNWIYLDVASVPEMALSRAARELVESAEFRERIAHCRSGRYVQHAEVARLKRELLSHLYDSFLASSRTSRRGDEFQRYLVRENDELVAHATYEALADQLSTDPNLEPDWRHWPAPYREFDSGAISAFRAGHRGIVDFYRWLQFELDRQLSQAGAELRVGLLTDLAVGASPAGSECWSKQAEFASAAVLGAPPDEYSEEGQSWGVAPMMPRTARRTRYRHFRRLLEANFRHSGALRIDHAMGLTRQFWVPADGRPHAGAYVSFPAEETFAVVGIESERAGAVVVAEDLGTVPAGFREDLAERGWLRTHVMYFERGDDGEYSPPDAYTASALAIPNTHDQPPLRGFAAGIDLRLRTSTGVDGGKRVLEAELARRELEYGALLRRLVADGQLDLHDRSTLSVCAATVRMLARSPAVLVGIGLDDLAAEDEPVNVPGVRASALPLWARRMRRDVVAILNDPEIVSLLQEARRIMDRDDGGG